MNNATLRHSTEGLTMYVKRARIEKCRKSIGCDSSHMKSSAFSVTCDRRLIRLVNTKCEYSSGEHKPFLPAADTVFCGLVNSR